MLDIGPIHRKEYEIQDARAETVVVAEAPGRIHFMGEHGEPGAGLYLSAAIDRHIRVAVSPRKDNSIRFYAADLGERKRTTLVNLKYKREDRWSNYVKAAILLFAQLGYPVKGLNFTICGDIPQQIGLASSSAIEAAAAMALRGMLRAAIPERELLQRILAAEEMLFERPAKTVDYMAILQARKDQFLVIDEAEQTIRREKSCLSRYKILIMDSKVPRMGVEDELSQRRKDLARGLELLSGKKEGASFRSYAATDLVESMGSLPEEIRRRCMHVVQEIRRVHAAADALKAADSGTFGKIVYNSHESLRDLYEVSCPEIDWLVKRAQELDGVLCSRMTGLGFGGCTYTFIREDAEEEYRKKLDDYERIFGFHPIIHEVKFSTGSRLLPA